MAEKKPAGQPEDAPTTQQTEVIFSEKNLHSAYANFARVTATPEEVIIDLALNSNPFATGRQEISIDQRLIMNFFTAKRLFTTLGMTLQKHEEAFGVIELDPRRRVRVQAPAAPVQGK
ncbi:MAG: DUF3467 domain-containing protein [Gemmataceae bacterium]|nr:DUF3467 domain-containing protein [Gemmataceae bacterium]